VSKSENSVKNIKELKALIKNEVLEGYRIKTNFSYDEFFVELGSFIIIAKTICLEKQVKYEFVLDTQFVPNNEITYDEIVMIKNVIDILNRYKKLAISRLKKWTVEEYLEDKRKKEKRSEEMLEALKKALANNINSI